MFRYISIYATTGGTPAVGIEIGEPELTEIIYNLNAILEAMGDIDIPGLNDQEPLPIIMPSDSRDG